MLEGKEKTQGREKKTEEDGVAVRDAKENASERESVKDLTVSSTIGRGALSSANKKNTEANTKVYDLHQKTIEALDVLAEEYEIFEATMKKVTHETEEVNMLFAAAYEACQRTADSNARPTTPMKEPGLAENAIDVQ